MSKLKGKPNPRGRTIHAKSNSYRDNEARICSIVSIESAMSEYLKKINKREPELGPRMRIKKYMNEYGVNVPDDDIIKYMSEEMPSLGKDYVKGLINKVRNEIKKEIEAKSGEKGDDR